MASYRIERITKGMPLVVLDVLQRADRSSAKVFHDDIKYGLLAAGYDVVSEYPVADRGDGKRGYIDLVVNNRLAIELDRSHPRRKSVFKLQSLPARFLCVVACRDPWSVSVVRDGAIDYSAG